MSWQVITRAVTYIAKKKLAEKAGRSSRRNRVAIGLLLAATPIGLILLTVTFGVAALTAATPSATARGALGIPPVVFAAYLAAVAKSATIAPECVLDWPVVAGIWKVESDHATIGGRTISHDGTVSPPIYGPRLDGSVPGTRVIADTDDGVLDGDPDWDRAVGTGQFLPSSWRAYGQDGNQDGVADPQNVYDAALSTAFYLCRTSPGDYMRPADLEAALFRYNNSTDYVATVSGWVAYYRAFQLTSGDVTADSLYAFPLPHDAVTLAQIRRTHHDYPAADLTVPEGTPVYAAHPGTVVAIQEPCPSCRCGYGVTVAGHDRHRYTYCHGTGVTVTQGTEVAAGQLIMTSGNTGNSTTPHLHFQIRSPDGHLICPQGPLEAWWNGVALSPVTAPTTGCTH